MQNQDANGSQYRQYLYANPEWYESLDYFQSSDELVQIVHPAIPQSWEMHRDGLQMYTYPINTDFPSQGWKIHVSTIPITCEELLYKVATICVENGVPFKFVIDRQAVSLLADRDWPNRAEGEFITIYPFSQQHFQQVIESLYQQLQGFSGPYVLSDRRYKDSQVLYYQYGSINGIKKLDRYGKQAHMLMSPEGELVPDLRTPYWNPPKWVSDPFKTENSSGDQTPFLKDGRYQIARGLGYSVIGGVYLAIDLETDRLVVIKEARPHTGIDSNGNDALDRFQKEYRLLNKLQDTNSVPAPIDLFFEWEHLFLVRENIRGLNFSQFIIEHNPILQVHPEQSEIDIFLRTLRKIWVNIALAVAEMHKNNIVGCDLSLHNIIIEDEILGGIRIISLEAAYEEGVDPPSQMAIPGLNQEKVFSRDDQYHSFGAMMLGTLCPINNILDLEPSASEAFIEALVLDTKLPDNIRQVITRCMNSQPAKISNFNQILLVIEQQGAPCSAANTDNLISKKELSKVVKGITDYICTNSDTARLDRLFPGDPLVFLTNPLSIAHGALGVAHALSIIQGEVPKEFRTWIVAHTIDADNYPPSLYMGLSGIAWVLWEIGQEDIALQTMQAADNHPLLWSTADLFNGSTGYGLANLHLYLHTKNQAFLDRAVQVGERLNNSRTRNVLGCRWPDESGNEWLGYAHGGSGIALFLLYLHIATGEKKFLKLGEEALAFDLAHLHSTQKGILSVAQSPVSSLEKTPVNDWLNGSAGVMTALVRFWVYTKNEKYFKIIENISQDIFRKYGSSPTLFRGLAGLGNALLDLYDFTGDSRYLQEAYRVANGISLFKIERSTGTAFAGEALLRISTDFGTGSAGIGLFLHRLIQSDKPIGNFNFVLDKFLL